MRYLLRPMIMRAWSTASHQFNYTLNLNEDVVENVIIEIISSASHRIDYHLKRKTNICNFTVKSTIFDHIYRNS